MIDGMSDIWFPSKQVAGPHGFITDTIQNDFEDQAKLYPGEVNYLQLSPGAFLGRMLSVFLGDIKIHVEYCSQSVEKEIRLPSSEFAFVVVLDDSSPELAYGGVTTSKDWVYVLPPNGECLTFSPPDCTVLVVKIKRDVLLKNPVMLPEMAEWFGRLNKRGEFIHSQWLADRLRADGLSALEGATASSGPERGDTIGRAVELSFVSAFTMQWLARGFLATFRSTPALERFQLARRLITGDLEEFDGTTKSSIIDFGSKRSIELAFSEKVKMGPLAYSRLVRLHNARRKLLDKALADNSIGDIAADEGFWDWSRFSAYYHRQFGELPSETRNRLIA